ncbi:putative ABC transporter permease [uncultured Bifidobacterium sp.]|uniref:putative ABC transporter permease n=1 Tax=uncultured Bifidobacterium sp. TaxID=165187 RepID=UPI0026315EEB|nr:putative ABC transporter permease [uncultured Bifidobacterium sp.]
MIAFIEQIFLWWLFYGFIGWVWETCLGIVTRGRFVERGVFIGPLCPIYGFGAIIVIVTLRDVENPLASFLSSGMLACLLEYVTSAAVERAFHVRLWDYTNKPFNVNGRIYLNGFLAFGLGASAVKLLVQPAVAGFTGSWAPQALHVVTITAAGILIADAAVTIAGLTSFDSHLAQISENIAQAKSTRIAAIDERLEKSGHGPDNVIEVSERIAKTMTWQQRRLIRAFPAMTSTRHGHTLAGVRDTLAKKAKRRTKER